MDISLTGQELATLLESLKYSKQRIADAQGTPPEVRKENLARIEAVLSKLRAAKNVAEGK